jgi:hypothetical protein
LGGDVLRGGKEMLTAKVEGGDIGHTINGLCSAK